MRQVLEFARGFVKEHPHLKHQVLDLVELCQTEIDEGGSPAHEQELCINSLKELLEEEED